MSWHWTWQDPVALALVVLVLLLVRWLKKRVEPAGCAACQHTGEPTRDAKPTRVSIDSMRLGKPRPRSLPPVR